MHFDRHMLPHGSPHLTRDACDRANALPLRRPYKRHGDSRGTFPRRPTSDRASACDHAQGAVWLAQPIKIGRPRAVRRGIAACTFVNKHAVCAAVSCDHVELSDPPCAPLDCLHRCPCGPTIRSSMGLGLLAVECLGTSTRPCRGPSDAPVSVPPLLSHAHYPVSVHHNPRAKGTHLQADGDVNDKLSGHHSAAASQWRSPSPIGFQAAAS